MSTLAPALLFCTRGLLSAPSCIPAACLCLGLGSGGNRFRRWSFVKSRSSGNPPTSQSPKSPHNSVPVRQLKLHDTQRLGLCSATAQLVSFQGYSSHLGVSSFMMRNCLAENTTSLSHRSCQTAIETLSPGWSQHWSMANLVMYCGIVVEVQKA